MTRSSSQGMPGISITRDPAAMMHWPNETLREPSSLSTDSSCESVNLPVPVMTSTLRFFAIPASPPVNLSTVSFLNFRSGSSSIFGSPKLTPCSARCAAESITWPTCSSALDGMQPTLRQTPPSDS